MAKPVVAVVGRPNVGKSTLFNKLIGKRVSIVEDTPGVTRDRIYSECEWAGKSFMLVDTGGIEPRSDDVILSQMERQAQLAIESADVIILVTDVTTGVTATDHDVATMLLKSGKPVVLCVNKCDSVGEVPADFYEFYNLGLGDPVAVSSVHGHGTGDLLETVFERMPQTQEEPEEDDFIKVAVIGKPNVGKSSLVNKIAGEERVIVSNIAGTTRDAVDTKVENEFGKFIFIDTAGIRRKSKIDGSIEHYSVLRSYMAVDRAQVCVIMIDATEGFTEQDSKVAGYAHEQGKACIIAVNKWDAVEKDGKTMTEFRKKLENDFSFMSYAPIVFISAKTGQRLNKLFELIHFVDGQNAMRISTGMLNDLLSNATARVQPPSDKGRRLKIYYMTQPSTRPPTFVTFVNRADLFHFSYQRYLENQIRATFGLERELRFGWSYGNAESNRGGIVMQLTTQFILSVLCSVVLCYLLGSLSFAIIVSKCIAKKDIREFGSGNAGMTNVLRTLGKRPGCPYSAWRYREGGCRRVSQSSAPHLLGRCPAGIFDNVFIPCRHFCCAWAYLPGLLWISWREGDCNLRGCAADGGSDCVCRCGDRIPSCRVDFENCIPGVYLRGGFRAGDYICFPASAGRSCPA